MKFLLPLKISVGVGISQPNIRRSINSIGTSCVLLVVTPPERLCTDICWVSPMFPTIASSLSPMVASTPKEGTPPPTKGKELQLVTKHKEINIIRRFMYTKSKILGIIVYYSLYTISILLNIRCLLLLSANPKSSKTSIICSLV